MTEPMTQDAMQEAEAYGDAWACLNTLRAYLSPELADQCQQQINRAFDVKSTRQTDHAMNTEPCTF